MHPSAIINAEKFVSKYLNPTVPLEIVDIGSFNVNGCLKPLFVKDGYTCSYCGNVKKGKTPPLCNNWDCFTDRPMQKYSCFNGVELIPLTLEDKEIGDLWNYRGLELESSVTPYGPVLTEPYKRYNVDIISTDTTGWPLEDNSIDIILSTSCLEHDVAFWKTFEEMFRVVRPGGLLYLNVPSTGGYHGYPLDCWRFMKDSYIALAQIYKDQVDLLDSHIDELSSWGDNIGIFQVKANT